MLDYEKIIMKSPDGLLPYIYEGKLLDPLINICNQANLSSFRISEASKILQSRGYPSFSLTRKNNFNDRVYVGGISFLVEFDPTDLDIGVSCFSLLFPYSDRIKQGKIMLSGYDFVPERFITPVINNIAEIIREQGTHLPFGRLAS